MTDEQRSDDSPQPQGYFWRMPYDWRRPTWVRFRARWWNRNDPRFFTPRSFGWGYAINFYRAFHPRQFAQTREPD
jgi:hypothetical protein